MTRQGIWRGALRRRRGLAVSVAVLTAAGLFMSPALALDWSTDSTGVAGPSGNTSDSAATGCPTFKSTPAAYEAFFNMSDMDTRGFGDAGNQLPWDFSKRIAQIVCGAAPNSTVNIGMFFMRALGTLDRPESDPNQIWNALDYVHTNRHVKVNIVSDNGSITSSLGRKQVIKRLGPGSKTDARILWCTNGCFESNKSSVLPNSINHEKFITISDTTWDTSGGAHPAVYSTSANISRGQTRNYMADGSLIYNDTQLYKLFVARFTGMQYCAKHKYCSLRGVNNAINNVSGQHMVLVDGRKMGGSYPNVWVDPIYRHPTDSGRGTTVSFSPQPQTARDYFAYQFDNVDCKVDQTVRVGMFRLSDTRAEQFARAAERLAKRGCDVKILLSPVGGAPTITKATASLLKKAHIAVRCSAVAMHTKFVLVGSRHNNDGRVLAGTANMSTSGLRYSDEHMLMIDSRRATGQYKGDARRYFAEFMSAWNEMNQGSTTCHPST